MSAQTHKMLKRSHREGFKVNGAGDGMIPEPKFEIFTIIDTDECRIIYIRIEKLLAV